MPSNKSNNSINTESINLDNSLKPLVDNFNRSYATGKRKTSIARVWVKNGVGKFIINNLTNDFYFKRLSLKIVSNQPFSIDLIKSNEFDVFCTVSGGGLSSQAGAIRHGLAKALALFKPSLRFALKSKGYITRDSRIVERKKYGKPKARKSFQFSKR